MKAIVINRYGGPDAVELADVEEPKIKPDEVLIRVAAVGLNAGDYFTVRGSPWLIRLSVGFPRPRRHILGWDVSGIVEDVGSQVKNFQPGDCVFGAGDHTLAEYVCAPENRLATLPAGLTLEQAAAVPAAALTALEALRDVAGVRPGHEVLINGASGGVGTFSVQIARALGASVTGVCSTRNVELVKSLGADHVIDYTLEDFTRSGRRYDVLLDNAGNRTFADCRSVLRPGGVHVPNSGHGGTAYVFKAYLLSAFTSQHLRPFMNTPAAENLHYLRELIASGQVRPVVDRTYPIEETRRALRYLVDEHAQGKVVITV